MTNAKPEIAAYPFTTRSPQPGIARWRDVRFQIVDLPPASAEFFEPWMPAVVRSADAALLVVDLADDDLIDAAEASLKALSASRTELVGDLPYDVEDEDLQHVKTVMVANKDDDPGSGVRFDLLGEWFGDRFPLVRASATEGTGLDEVRRSAYDSLGVMRIYTKVPGYPADRENPFTVPTGSTVLDLAREVHRDLEDSFKSARSGAPAYSRGRRSRGTTNSTIKTWSSFTHEADRPGPEREASDGHGPDRRG